MNPDRWKELQRIFAAAVQQERDARTEFVRLACNGDAELQAEVEALLLSNDAAPDYLAKPAFNLEDLSVDLNDHSLTEFEDELLPVAIGGYRIVRRIGKGGMGSVYEAEQEEPRRIVALKVIRPDSTNDPEFRWRFRREAQALARLQHPGIAQIYDAGGEETEAGLQLFFVMEFIHGDTLLFYAGKHQLSTRQRLELMVKICEAVHHAHQRGLIHRDLKPGNILVDNTGQPKVLDFGVARIVDTDVHATRQTDIGKLVGTLTYMSPEQLLADPLMLDTRSDVYALGVILYELLAGKLPYHVSCQVHEAARAIQEDDPTPLSFIHREFRGDIETIAAKALEKDRARRYSSASDLAADIRHFLGDEPIAARRPTAAYQIGKFTRRHKSLVTATAAVFSILVAGIVVSTRQAVLVARAEQRAQAVNDFLRNDLLSQANVAMQGGPATEPDPHIEVRTVLDRAAVNIAGKFGAQPEVEATIRETIGQTYKDMGLYKEARTHLERALQLYRQELGPENPKTLTTMRLLGGAFQLDARYPEAATLLTQTLQLQRRVLGPENPETLGAMNNLAIVYFFEGKYREAEPLYSETLAIQRRRLGPDHPDTLQSMHNLANNYLRQGKYAEAEALGGQALDGKRRVLGPQHPDTLNSMNALAVAYLSQAKYAQAEALQAQTLDLQRRILGPTHPNTLASMNNLANSYYQLGKYPRAEALYREAFEKKGIVLGKEHPDTLVSLISLASALGQQAKYAEADALFSRAIEICRRTLGIENQYTFSFLCDWAAICQRQGRYDKAQALLAESLVAKRKRLGADSPDTMDTAADLALAFQSQRRFAESEPLAREADEFARKARQDEWQRFRAESLLGASLAGQKNYTAAEPALLDGYRGMLARKGQIAVPDRYHLDLAGKWVIQLYKEWGKPEKAVAWRKARANP